MAESDRRRVITSTPHLTPEQITQRTFATSFRGYSEADVRAFLKRISEELVVTRDREAELLSVIDDLESQLRAPRPLNEPEMLDALGAETTRLLRSAREAADEIRTKGEERAARILDEARAEADRMLAEAEERARLRTEEAEEHAALLMSESEARAAELQGESERHAEAEQQRVARESEEQVETARQQGRDMLEEAKSTRERVLADLFRRRSLLQAQIDELRAGRDNLLDAYRVVKRSFLDATNALAQVEARAAEERAHGDAESSDELAEELRAATGEAEAEAAAEAAPTASADDSTDAGLADVDSLFARLRAGQEASAEAEPVPSEPAAEAEEPAESAEAAPEEPEAPARPEPPEEPAVAEPEAVAEPTPPEVWRAKRSEVLDPLIVSMTKKAKRAAQDDQNLLLDAVRRHKGRPTSVQVLEPEAELISTWTELLRDAIDEAYGGGRAAIGADVVPADTSMAREAAETIVLPLRERISSAIDAGAEGDTSGLVERIGARFREWKNQSLEELLVDELSGAWSQGVYDASPDGAVFRWIPLVEGRCADCDDNGLEPTTKGSSFPTGQLHPPAHPGCRCLLAPADT